MDTIFALATAQGRAGVAVVRISGPHARAIAGLLMADVPTGRGLRQLRNRVGEPLDEALVLSFEKGASFTGEEVVELHLHGSVAVVSAVLRELSEAPNARTADAGEFTRRALENGQLDLSQVEGLADLIDAETEGQRRQALRVLSGALGDLAESWRSKLLRAAALIEATIDFADEDVPVDVTPEVRELLTQTKEELDKQVQGVAIAERIRSGFEIAIVGAPNVGKSTLLNFLAGRDAAITSEIAGTTRDVIEVRMELGGLPVTFLDTAGLRETDDKIEEIGVQKAIRRASESDLIIYMLGTDEEALLDIRESDIVVVPKDDVGSSAGFGISGVTGYGVDRLVSEIQDRLSERVDGVGAAIRERHRVAMIRCSERLDTVLSDIDVPDYLADVAAEDLRDGIRAIDSLVGRIDVEDLLGEIFSSFCIGK